jgi:glycosyltransferase involved in cell wall biosynthesis
MPGVKKNILVFSDWYLPAYKAGGPVKSIAALGFHLKEEFNFYIITSNKDLFESQPYKTVKTNEWNILPNGEHVFYFSDEAFSLKNLKALLQETAYDAVYLNSFFSKRCTIYPLLLKKSGHIKKPVIIAPRGMLSSGALQLKSKKKSAFIALAKLFSLYKDLIWQATSVQEENEIKNIFGAGATILRVSNLSLPPIQQRIEYNKQVNEVKICCVARISKVKNIRFALEVLQSIQTGTIIFDLYGPAEEADYYAACMELAAKLPENIHVSFKGDLQGNEVEQALKQYHLFFLPTLNENFGHAIVEAMQNGCIPLISDRTPWRNLQAQAIGWDIALDEKEKFVAAIQEVLAMPQTAFEERSKAIQQYALTHCMDVANIDLYKKLFL